MQIIEKKISELKPYGKNPRKNDGAVDYVAKSIEQFGFKVPIVIDNNGVIVCGHTRLKAAKKLGIKSVPCVIADDLTDEQIKAFRLADNKTAEFAEWDFDLLEEELNDILDIDMGDFGFDITQSEITSAYESLLSDEDYISLRASTDKDNFGITFVFPLSFEDEIKSYIRDVTKQKVCEMIIQQARRHKNGG